MGVGLQLKEVNDYYWYKCAENEIYRSLFDNWIPFLEKPMVWLNKDYKEYIDSLFDQIKPIDTEIIVALLEEFSDCVRACLDEIYSEDPWKDESSRLSRDMSEIKAHIFSAIQSIAVVNSIDEKLKEGDRKRMNDILLELTGPYNWFLPRNYELVPITYNKLDISEVL